LNYWLNSDEHGQRYFERCMYGQGRPHLSFEQLGATPIALPPLAEQHRIVAEVDRRLSLLRETVVQVDANLRRAERLRQSILSRAFSGELLPASRSEHPIEDRGLPLGAAVPARCAVAS
jgi:type I restriction enzyme S subunit